MLPSTNSLGLPLIKQARAGEIFHVLEENDKKQELTPKQQMVELVLPHYFIWNYK